MTKPGFTLIEMLFAISIIAIMTAVGIPFYQNIIKNLNLNSVSRSLASDLRYAQQLAVTTQVNHGVIFSILNNSYQLKNQGTQTVIKTVTIDDGIRLDSIVGLESDTATFNATGAATSTGIITLINENNRTSTIEIKPSGYVKIQ
jgi:prepilin-type N-terminal cleavage/methylation domain-containing protein